MMAAYYGCARERACVRVYVRVLRAACPTPAPRHLPATRTGWFIASRIAPRVHAVRVRACANLTQNDANFFTVPPTHTSRRRHHHHHQKRRLRRLPYARVCVCVCACERGCVSVILFFITATVNLRQFYVKLNHSYACGCGCACRRAAFVRKCVRHTRARIPQRGGGRAGGAGMA